MKYVHGILLEDPFGDNTRETICGILIEVLLLQDDMVVDGVKVYDMLFELLDRDNQQLQLGTTNDNIPPITSLPTNTKKTNNDNKQDTHTTKRLTGTCHHKQ